MEAIIRLVEISDWKMFPLKPYDAFHIGFFILGLFLIHRISDKLKHCSVRTSNRILFGLGMFLFVIEIYKQLFYYVVVTPGEYSWWILPFQICSTPMYLLLALPFVKKPAYQETILHYCFAIGIFGGLASYLEPSGMMHEYWTLTLHSFVWHMILIFAGVHILKNRSHGFGSFAPVRKLFLSFSALALIINITVKFSTGAYINMFFMGPAQNPIILLKDIHSHFGWPVSSAVLVAFVTLTVGWLSGLLLTVYHKREAKEAANIAVAVETGNDSTSK